VFTHDDLPARDPLSNPGDRFPLGPTRGVMRGSMQGPSGPATRPYSLRGVVTGARVSDGPAVHWVYCPDRQVALVYDDNGVLVPTAGTHTKPGATPGETSGHVSPDGQGGSDEEVGDPDQQDD